MASKQPEGCVQPAKGPISAAAKPDEMKTDDTSNEKGGTAMQVMVGKEAPDFEASAFHQGGFKTVKLSDYKGKWVFLCFYPGDFTFV